MIDLTDVLTQRSNVVVWSPESAYAAAVAGAETAGIQIDWDRDDQEEWISLLVDTHRVGMISAQEPFAIVSDAKAGLAEPLIQKGLKIILVESFDDTVLVCNAEKLVEVFGSGARTLIRYSAFSANDLWFATI